MKRVWTTKNGTKLKIKDMTTHHITNCIALLERYHSTQLHNAHSFLNTLHGEMAIETMENNIASLEEDGWQDKAEEYIDSFQKELERRKNER
jgi:hypothetical protein